MFSFKTPVHRPMDTNCEEEIADHPLDAGNNQRLIINTLFQAVATGDTGEVQNVLDQMNEQLSHSFYRSDGKTALMKALLHYRDGRNGVVDLLISTLQGNVEDFVNAAYTSKYYKGLTALHIAIERRSLYCVQLLLSNGADVHAKACGTFFQPHDGTYFYFGELPLSLAACTNQPALVDFLLDNQHQSANAAMIDSQGNTVLHVLVLVNNEDNTEFITTMYDRILRTADRLQPDQKIEAIRNREKLTPLTMAAKMGKIGILSHILKREFREANTKHLSRKFTQWVYGPVQSSLYDLTAVDSRQDDSVIEHLTNSGVPNRHAMLEMEPLNCLMEAKWNKFARTIFFFNFLVYMAYLITFTFVACSKEDENPSPIEHSFGGYMYVSGQLLTLVSNSYFFLRGIFDIIKKRRKFKMLLVDSFYDILFFIQGVLCLVTTVLYYVGWPSYVCFMVLCLALSFVNLLYFAQGDEHMGIYSVMIQKMILNDIMRFLLIYIVFLFGFSTAVSNLLIEPPPKNTTGSANGSHPYAALNPGEEVVKPTHRSIPNTALQLFKLTIGMGNMEFTEHFVYKEVVYVILISFIILTYILLLNTLIALINRTVENIIQERTGIWRLQRAMIILDIEAIYCCWRKRDYRLKRDVGRPRPDECWFIRVEEVNPENETLSKINEDKGSLKEEAGEDIFVTAQSSSDCPGYPDIQAQGQPRHDVPQPHV